MGVSVSSLHIVDPCGKSGILCAQMQLSVRPPQLIVLIHVLQWQRKEFPLPHLSKPLMERAWNQGRICAGKKLAKQLGLMEFSNPAALIVSPLTQNQILFATRGVPQMSASAKAPNWTIYIFSDAGVSLRLMGQTMPRGHSTRLDHA